MLKGRKKKNIIKGGGGERRKEGGGGREAPGSRALRARPGSDPAKCTPRLPLSRQRHRGEGERDRRGPPRAPHITSRLEQLLDTPPKKNQKNFLRAEPGGHVHGAEPAAGCQPRALLPPPPPSPFPSVPVFCSDSRPFCGGVLSGGPSGGCVASAPAAAGPGSTNTTTTSTSSSNSRAGRCPRSPSHMVAPCRPPPPPPPPGLHLLLPAPARCPPRPRAPHVPGAAASAEWRLRRSPRVPQISPPSPAGARMREPSRCRSAPRPMAAAERSARPPGGRPRPGGRLQPPAPLWPPPVPLSLPQPPPGLPQFPSAPPQPPSVPPPVPSRCWGGAPLPPSPQTHPQGVVVALRDYYFFLIFLGVLFMKVTKSHRVWGPGGVCMWGG